MVWYKERSYVSKFFLLIAVTSSLTACKEESDSNDVITGNEPSVAPTLATKNTSLYVNPSSEYQLNLASENLVVTSDGSPFVVKKVQPLSQLPECQVISWDKENVIVHAPASSMVCDYRFEVDWKQSQQGISRNSSFQAGNSGIMRVVVSQYAATTTPVAEFTPVSEVVTLDSSEVNIDLKQKIVDIDNSGLPNDWRLSSTITPVYNLHGSVKNVDSTAGTFDYAPPEISSVSGIDRWMYSYEDQEGNVVKIGVIDIAFSESVNKGLVIEDPIDNTRNKVVWRETLTAGDEHDIDIESFITSIDDDDYQLVHVTSFYSTVGVKNPNDPHNAETNKVFTFKGSTSGRHYVNFAVSDRKGSYEIGLMELSVIDSSQLKDWQNIPLGIADYTAPYTIDEAKLYNEPYTIGLIDGEYDPAIEVATFLPSRKAKEYCASMARLPTLAELEQLASLNAKAKYDWPTQHPYISLDGSTYSLVDLDTGDVSAYGGNAEYNVTCFRSGELNATVKDGDAAKNGIDEGQVLFKAIVNGEPVSQIQVVLSGFGSSASPNSTAKTDASVYYPNPVTGEFLVKVTNTEDELTTVAIRAGDETATGQVWFGELKTARLNGLVINSNNAVVSDGSPNILQASVINNAGALPYQPIEVTFEELPNDRSRADHAESNINDSYNLINPEELITNTEGKALVKVKTNQMEQIKVIAHYKAPLGNQYGETKQEGIVSWCDLDTLPITSYVESNDRIYTSPPQFWMLEACGLVGNFDAVADNWHQEQDHGPTGADDYYNASMNHNNGINWCNWLNSQNFAGRSDWRLPKDVNELTALYNNHGKQNFWRLYSWPSRRHYWTDQSYGSRKYGVSLSKGSSMVITKSDRNLVTCSAAK
ncbi:Lcl domain-containing protein [Vibrio jasicida]|uniref:Lcl domain-containing protein n=1 Tax=Vibrio jasicida TaxID=766224 RepID=UPI0005F02B2E|nr:DUF1566 domain-containing protein [Vibrio jasicida]